MAMELDPVCGMHVDPRNALQSTHDGKSYYFCSEDCRAKWDADPEKHGSEKESAMTSR